MTRVQGFPPIADRDAERLILGSMPGRVSLAQARYYAHPRNAFWPILGALLGFDPQIGYVQRCRRLRDAHIALWDVLATCHRPGSLDSSIDRASLVVNDFGAFFASHPRIRRLYFNGAAAEQLFRRYVLPQLAAADRLTLERLPSTSPANASYSLERKLEAWRVLAPVG